MKRCFAAMLMLMLMTGAGLAERTIYAFQGDAAVFEENGMVGMVNREGEVILPARYEAIRPSGHPDYLVLYRDGCKGLMDLNGRIVLDCEYSYIGSFDPERGWVQATLYESGIEQLLDLHTGEILLQAENENQQIFWNDDYVVLGQYNHMSALFGDTLLKKIYDTDLNFLFEIHDAVDLFEHSVYIKTGDFYNYAILNPDGSLLVDQLFLCWELEDGTLSYEKKISGEPDDPLSDENGMIRMVGLIDDRGIMFERPGHAIYDVADEQELYRVAGRNGWIYVDSTGRQVFPESYDEAYPFVDGAAVVKQDEYFLIDTEGNAVGNLKWTWSPEEDMDWMWAYGWELDKLFSFPVFPVGVEGGYRLADRQGNSIGDVLWKEIYEMYGEEPVFICKDFDDMKYFIGMDGREVAPGAWEDICEGEVPGYAWVKRDGLWGKIDLFGAVGEPGAYLSDDRYSEIYNVYDYFTACLPDGETWVYCNSRGAAISPGHEPVEYL